MNTQQNQFVPHAKDTTVMLTASVPGIKIIDGAFIDHALPAGATCFVKECVDRDTRTSISTDPLSSMDYVYKLQGTIVQNHTTHEEVGPVYEAVTERQKIRHTALDTFDGTVKEPGQFFQVGELARIRSGNQYTFGNGPNATTFKGGDVIYVRAPGTTKTGGPALISNNAYYLSVQRAKISVKQKEFTWRSKRAVADDKFRVVENQN